MVTRWIDSQFNIFAGIGSGPNKLESIDHMHIIIFQGMGNQQWILQILNEIHRSMVLVFLFIFGKYTHIALRINIVVKFLLGDRSTGYSQFKSAGMFGQGITRCKPSITVSLNGHAIHYCPGY